MLLTKPLLRLVPLHNVPQPRRLKLFLVQIPVLQLVHVLQLVVTTVLPRFRITQQLVNDMITPNLNRFHLKDQHLIGCNYGRTPPFAVRQLTGNVQFPFSTCPPRP